jgi:regulatory protein
MKITAIKQQVKNPQRVSIFIDNKYEFSLSLDELVKYKVKNGDELDEASLKKFKKISEDGKLRARALEWLLNRPHSTREFKDYLYRKKADPALADSLINEFSTKGYLDDTKFAAWFIDLQARKHKSRRAIRAELLKKGIGSEQLDELFMEEMVDEEQALRELVAKKKGLSRYKNDPIKLKQYLLRRGFSYEAINKTLNNT